MADRSEPLWGMTALDPVGGESPSIDVASHIWRPREAEQGASGDLPFIWQYDMRRAATALRTKGRLGRGWARRP